MKRVAVLLLAVGFLAGPAFAEVVCETRPKRVRLLKYTWGLGHETKCRNIETELDQLQKLDIACGLMIKAYGEKKGQRRCRELIRNGDFSD